MYVDLDCFAAKSKHALQYTAVVYTKVLLKYQFFQKLYAQMVVFQFNNLIKKMSYNIFIRSEIEKKIKVG